MATAWLAGLPTEDVFGFYLADEQNILDGMVAVPQSIEIPNVVGSFYAGPAKVSARRFTLRGWVEGTSFADTRAKLRDLKDLLDQGLLTVRVADWSDVMIEAKCVGFQAENLAPKQLQPIVDLDLTFEAPCPYWRDVCAIPYAFSSTPTEMPTGNVSVAPDLWILGAATNPVVKGYKANGDEDWSATFTIALGATDALRIVTSGFEMAIYKYLNSFTPVRDDTLLTAGIFPRPLHATKSTFRFSQWQRLSTSAGQGRAIFPRLWG